MCNDAMYTDNKYALGISKTAAIGVDAVMVISSSRLGL
jgi:hypothetical protein